MARPAEHDAIHPQTTVGGVHLTVASLSRSLEFYTRALGFRVVSAGDGSAGLAASGAPPAHIRLTEQPGARPQPPGTSGLYHFAVLHPTRAALARTLRRLLPLGVQIEGAADHLVSEAIYLTDPDGHGIEIYTDRPREAWPRRGGRLLMHTVPLDLEDLLRAAGPDDAASSGLDPQTRIGHVHLRTGDIAAAVAFYRDLLGFEEVTWYGPRALFLAAGGYHHHIGLNTWGGVGVPPPPPDAVRLRGWTIVLPDTEELRRVARRVQEGAPDRVIAAGDSASDVRLRGPDDVAVVLTT